MSRHLDPTMATLSAMVADLRASRDADLTLATMLECGAVDLDEIEALARAMMGGLPAFLAGALAQEFAP